jgi:hypothetical protein
VKKLFILYKERNFKISIIAHNHDDGEINYEIKIDHSSNDGTSSTIRTFPSKDFDPNEIGKLLIAAQLDKI